MAAISVTINTPASGPFNVAQLFAGNTYSGAVTVAPTKAQGIVQPPSEPDYFAIQADPANTSGHYILVGDKQTSPAETGAWGARLTPGTLLQVQAVKNALQQRWVNATNSGDVVNIEVLGGAQ